MFEVCVKSLKRLSIKAFAVSLSLTTALTPAYAAPIGGQVTQGQGVISQLGNATSVLQTTDKLVVEWQSFDTINGETVTFLQPTSEAWALNRIMNGQATSFDGSLFANGNVIITNGAGIHFGPNSFVDVGSLIASTSDISDKNFLANQFVFDRKGNSDAMVTNAGMITVQESGLAALVAPGVENSGYIQADLGTVILGAGETHTLDFFGDGLIKFAITTPTSATPKKADGSDADALVTNSGSVKADGGTVIMTASQASNILSSAINMSGIAQANSVSTRGGKIILGGGGGRVRISGKVRATAKVDVVGPAYIPVRGGTVHITGTDIKIADGAEIDTSGLNGGGHVLIGGAFQGGGLDVDGDIGYQLENGVQSIMVGKGTGVLGAGYIPEADNVDVANGATIDVSAIDAGDAGTAVVWSEDQTSFAGQIIATGGANAGDGGLVEVSGKKLAYNGLTDTRAANGYMGSLLLDPIGIHVIDGEPEVDIVHSADPVLTITDGTLNEYLGYSNVLLATSSSQANIVADGEVPVDEVNVSDNDDRIVIGDGTHIEARNFGVRNVDLDQPENVGGILYLSTGTLDLYSTIAANVSGGISSPYTPDGITLRDPHTVNVFDGEFTKGSVTQALELVAAAGTIGIGEGTFEKFTVAREGITITGQGETSIVQAGSPAITVAANNVTVQNLLLTGTNAAGEIGVLLDGSTAPNLTGINIVNVDMQDLDEGVLSVGDIGDGDSSTVDVSIRGNSSSDKAEMDNFLEDAIDLGEGDRDADAVYEVKNVVIENAGDDGIDFGRLKAATVQGVEILSVAEEGIDFDRNLNDASVLIGGTEDEHANIILGGDDGIATRRLTGGTFDVRGNIVIAGGDEGIQFERRIIDADVFIRENLAVGGLDDGIYFEGRVADSDVQISDNYAIGGGDDGINVEVISASSFKVEGNRFIAGIDGSAIEFDGTIRSESNILVSGNGDVRGAEIGIEFDARVRDSSVEVSENDVIKGYEEDGIHFDSRVFGSDVNITENGRIEGAENGILFAQRTIESDVLISKNNSILGDYSNGITFGNTVEESSVEISQNTNIEGGGYGILFATSGRRGSSALAGTSTVLIDKNGALEQAGLAYDGTQTVVLDDQVIVGQVHGVEGSGIAFYGAIADDAAVTISRNIVAENYVGIEFDEISSTSTQKVHNNFVGNGSKAGIGFFGDVTSPVEIFQNYIMSNSGDGIGVYKPYFDSNQGSGPNIGNGNIRVHQNYLPGSEDDFPNEGFAINNEGTGDMETAGNWWGTAEALGVAAALNGVSVPTDFLKTGVDTNVEESLGETEYDNFAFQSGEALVEPPVVIVEPPVATVNLPGILPLKPVRVTNIQAPADHFLRPVDVLTILPEGVFKQDYTLGECKVVGTSSGGTLQLQCNVLQSDSDVAFVVQFMGNLPLGEVASLN